MSRKIHKNQRRNTQVSRDQVVYKLFLIETRQISKELLNSFGIHQNYLHDTLKRIHSLGRKADWSHTIWTLCDQGSIDPSHANRLISDLLEIRDNINKEVDSVISEALLAMLRAKREKALQRH